jgi:hypothetical protein
LEKRIKKLLAIGMRVAAPATENVKSFLLLFFQKRSA